MLVLRYFGYVGGALLALLLVCAAMLPKPPASDTSVASAAAEGPIIRIHSERKWPERIVLDTNAPMPAPPVRVAAQPAPALAPVPAEAAAKARTSEALAQLRPEQPPKRVAQLRKPEPRVVPRRRIARARFAPSPYAYAYAPSYYGYGRSPRTMQVAQQHFGFFW
jgi:cell wall-associated NlpC family hydrolase